MADIRPELFRQEALDAQRHRWLGEIDLTSSRLGWFVAAWAIIVIVGVAIALLTVHYTPHIRVRGRLVYADLTCRICPWSVESLVRVLPGYCEQIEDDNPLPRAGECSDCWCPGSLPATAKDSFAGTLLVLSRNPPLQAELWIPRRFVGQVSIDTQVLLHYLAPGLGPGEPWPAKILYLDIPTASPGEGKGFADNQDSGSVVRAIAGPVPAVIGLSQEASSSPVQAVDAVIFMNRQRLIDWLLRPILRDPKSIAR